VAEEDKEPSSSASAAPQLADLSVPHPPLSVQPQARRRRWRHNLAEIEASAGQVYSRPTKSRMISMFCAHLRARALSLR
jgi:hypothetical protein